VVSQATRLKSNKRCEVAGREPRGCGANRTPRQIKRAPISGPFSVKAWYLYRYDIFCLRALLALRDSEFDLLAFSERFEAVALDRAEMRGW
jgi:hypothetical protein